MRFALTFLLVLVLLGGGVLGEKDSHIFYHGDFSLDSFEITLEIDEYLSQERDVGLYLYVVDSFSGDDVDIFIDTAAERVSVENENISDFDFVVLYSMEEKDVFILYYSGCIYDLGILDDFSKEVNTEMKHGNDRSLMDLFLKLDGLSKMEYSAFLLSGNLCPAVEKNGRLEINLKYDPGYVERRSRDSGFVPREPFNLYDELVCESEVEPVDGGFLNIESESFGGVSVFLDVDSWVFNGKSNLWEYRIGGLDFGWVDNDKDADKIIDIVSSGAEVSCVVKNIGVSRVAPMTNCVHESGSNYALFNIVEVLGRSSVSMARLLSDNKSNSEYDWLRERAVMDFDGGLNKFQPFMEYSDVFSVYYDLKIVEDYSMKMNDVFFDNLEEEKIVEESSCSDGRIYNFYNERGYYGYARSDWKYIAMNINEDEDAQTVTFIHELGHAFGGLRDEYYSNFRYDSVLSEYAEGLSLSETEEELDELARTWYTDKNCVKVPSWSGAYGKLDINNPGCGAWSRGYYFPSENSMMNLNSERGFNVVSCGYLVQKILGGENLDFYWDKCLNYNDGVYRTECNASLSDGGMGDCLGRKGWDEGCFFGCSSKGYCIDREEDVELVWRKNGERIKGYCNDGQFTVSGEDKCEGEMCVE